MLGLSYDQLGCGVARQWNLPATIVSTIGAVREHPVSAARYEESRAQVIAAMACAITEASAEAEAPARTKRLAAVVAQFGQATGTDLQAAATVAEEARKQFSRDAAALGLGSSRLAKPIAGPALHEGSVPRLPDESIGTFTGETSTGPAGPDAPTAPVTAPPRAERRAMLTTGIQDITQALAGDFSLNDVMRAIVETAHRAMGFRRVLLFIRDPKAGTMRCRIGLGAGAAQLVASGFAIPADGPRTLFTQALAEGLDLCIPDIDADPFRQSVPAWFRGRVATRDMMLLPARLQKKPVALLYADMEDPAALAFDPEELGLLKTLRNQVVLALRASD